MLRPVLLASVLLLGCGPGLGLFGLALAAFEPMLALVFVIPSSL